jgi:hypothetical protein
MQGLNCSDTSFCALQAVAAIGPHTGQESLDVFLMPCLEQVGRAKGRGKGGVNSKGEGCVLGKGKGQDGGSLLS